MSTFTANGLPGAFIIALVVCVVYLIATKKSSWSLPGLPKTGVSADDLKRYVPWLLALAGIAVFYWGLYTPGLRLSQVGDWSSDHWLWLLIFWGIIAAIIALNAKALGTMAKTLQTTAMVAMFLLFLGIPAGFWVRDLFLPTIICPDVSAHQTRSCNINTAWSTWIKAAEGPAVDGMQICATPGGQFERTDANGTTFYRFKTDGGRLVKAYRLFPANTACPATLP